MITRKLISVIIPVYNTGNYLKKCLETVINQTYKDIEIILINDGSTDNSLDICKYYQGKDNRVIVKTVKNNGVSSARNFGLSIAKGEYIMFIDSDDYIELNMIEKLYLAIENSKVDISMCDIKKVDEENNEIFVAMNNNDRIITNKEFMENIFDFDYSYGYPYNKLFKRKVIGKIKFDINAHYMEDFKFICEVIQNSKKIVYLKDKLYSYVQRSTSSLHQKYNEKWLSRNDIQKELIDKYLSQMNEKSKSLFLFDYIMMILTSYAFLKKENRLTNEIKTQIIKERNKYYKYLINSKYLTLYDKFKLFNKSKAPILYYNLKYQ